MNKSVNCGIVTGRYGSRCGDDAYVLCRGTASDKTFMY